MGRAAVEGSRAARAHDSRCHPLRTRGCASGCAIIARIERSSFTTRVCPGLAVRIDRQTTDQAVTAPTTVAKPDIVEGLGKGLRVIEAFDDEHPRLSASEAAALTGLSRTAARRHLLSLVHFGYATTDGRQFQLTPRVLRLGQSWLGAARLPRLVQPFIQRLALQCGETVNVSILDGHEVVYVARASPPRWVSIGYQVGVRVPAHGVTPGVVFAAAMPPAQRQAWIAAHDFTALAARTVTDPAQFRAAADEARSRGHWLSWQQLDPSLGGIALPLLDRRGRCHAAVGMTVPCARTTPEQMVEQLLPPLRATAQELAPLL